MFLRKINAYRVENGLHKLYHDIELSSLCCLHISTGIFDDIFELRYAGNDAMDLVFDRFIEDDYSRDMILREDFDYVGICVKNIGGMWHYDIKFDGYGEDL